MLRKLILLMCLISTVVSFSMVSTAYAGGMTPPKEVIVTPASLEEPVVLSCKLDSEETAKTKVILSENIISIFYENSVLEVTSFKSFIETKIWENGSEGQWFKMNVPMNKSPIGLTTFTIRLQKSIRTDAAVIPLDFLSNETETFTSINWKSSECSLVK